MNKKRRVPKFRRATPAVRREALVEATLHCLKKYGHDGASVRRISAAAGVSIGLINHHFPGKSRLIAEAYETLALSLQDSLRARAQNRTAAPRKRLSDFFRALLRIEHPGARLPGRLMAQVLGMAAGKLGDPVPVLILMKADDGRRRGLGPFVRVQFAFGRILV